MADKEIIDLPAVEISDLPTAESVADDILLPCYVPGSTDPAQNVTGAQLRGFAERAGESAGAEAGRKAAADLQKGDKGDTPVKGVDYWTAEDRAAMVADVLAALPVAEGGSF